MGDRLAGNYLCKAPAGVRGDSHWQILSMDLRVPKCEVAIPFSNLMLDHGCPGLCFNNNWPDTNLTSSRKAM